MIGRDINVVIRFLVQDDAVQSKAATDLFSSRTPDKRGFICSIVLAEIIWVLSRAYKVERNQIANVIERLLRSEELVIETASAAYRALDVYRHGSTIGLPDALIAQIGT